MFKLALTEKRRMNCDGYIFPAEYYEIPGVSSFQDVEAVKKFVLMKMEQFSGRSIEVYINGGMAIELLTVLQAASSLNIELGLLHLDRQSEKYVLQNVRWKATGELPEIQIPEQTFALCSGRHKGIQGEAIFDQISEENIFDLSWQEQRAYDFLKKHTQKQLYIYLSGLTALYVSVLNAASDLGRQITWLHYDYDTEDYFPHRMDG